ncbi:MAG TPA: hypothetical protein VNM14_20935 [Planctomycetota bacterium]|jgi:hypothetical protein|nr:hypothetical protein [Planctomycetota bacterium]
MTTEDVLLIAGISIGTLVISGGLAGWMLVRIPPDYFKSEKKQKSRNRPLWLKILKNAAGVLLVAVGLVLSLPGVPGQGLLLVLAGIMITDIPGKYKVERKILSKKPIRKVANKLRAWRHRPPLEFPQT